MDAKQIDYINIKNRLAAIHTRITNACELSGRKSTDVQLMLATKTVPADRIAIAVKIGEHLIGENKIQELRDKNHILKGQNLERHFIGHLQSNKIKDVIRYADCIQTIDRISIAEALNKRLEDHEQDLDIMVQVNTSFETSKFGIRPEEIADFISQLKKLPRLRITGLMTIGLFDEEAEKVRPSFTLLRLLKDRILETGLLSSETFRHLSMGMSGDLEIAVEEGATIVRVGTAIFGQRIYPDSYYWNEKDIST
jgi:pyridoxal phosphate enzyme (YggS family)